MKKLFLSLLLAASATTVLGFAACNENNKEEPAAHQSKENSSLRQ